MIFSQIFRHGVLNASHSIKTNSIQNTTFKRLFFNKIQKLLLPEKRNMGAYEGDGKTVGFVINKKNSEVLLLSEVMVDGFKLSSGQELIGSLVLFPHSVLSWHILRAKDLSEDSMILFKILQPKIDILVFGYGTRNDYTPEVKENFTKICKKFGLRYEALPTEDAVGLYNFLAEDRVLVAGALLPPAHLDVLKFERHHKFLDDGDFEDVELISQDKIETKLLK